MGSQPETAKPNNRLRLGLAMLVVAAALYFAGRALGWWGGADDEGGLKLYGNVEIREVELGFRVGGRIERLLVDEGERVSAGQSLARLDTRPLRDRLATADARLEAAAAGAARDVNGNRPQQIREAEAALADAQATLGESRRLHERRAALLAKGFISRADYQSSEAGVAAATARVSAARAGLSLAQEGARVEDRAVSAANRDAVSAERRAVQTDLSDAELRAPEGGQVLTRAREAGAIVQPGETVLTVALTQPVRVRAYVAEPDLPKVRPGMKVSVRVDGSDKRWPATIGYIAPVAEFTPKTVQTEQLRADLVYRLRLTVEDPKGELRQGQPVTVLVTSPAEPR
ncbi:MAG TPA: HlyD family efflux transporter periplasmic adaptor subunit [Novosphingobium sp.]|nr:HlyD family efflux transporter periplasmic adaptor subunit [Novosphingobium sp.]